MKFLQTLCFALVCSLGVVNGTEADTQNWQDYVDTSLIATGSVKDAAIVGADGSIKALKAGSVLKPAEAKALSGAFNNPAKTQAEGIYFGGKKHFVLNIGEQLIRAKQGAGGLTIAKTKTLFIVGTYENPMQPGKCDQTVEKLAAHLIDLGY